MLKKDKGGASDVARDESELLGEAFHGEIFVGSQQELDQAAQYFYQSPTRESNVVLGDSRAQVLGLDSLSIKPHSMCPRPQVPFCNGR